MSDEEYVERKLPGRIYFSREVPVRSGDKVRHGRYVSRVLPGAERPHFADVQHETVLRVTRSGREQIKAFFLVDDRKVRTLTLQRFSAESGTPREQAHFSLIGDEIKKFLDLALLVRTAQFTDGNKVRLEQADLANFSLSRDAVRTLLESDQRLLREVLQQEMTDRDLIAIGYRRKELARFERLLRDNEFFEAEQKKSGAGLEGVWQQFFEANPWIFGYGLFYVFTSGFDETRLEQIVAGSQVGAAGKRADALLRTRGIVSSLCFVEIKTHRTPLVENEAYRSDTWAPYRELTAAVAQSQKTVDSAERALGRRLYARDKEGVPSGESAFLLRPRSVVVAGSLEQFVLPGGINEPKFTCFELYRRQLVAPEIVTFDELFERAKFIVDTSGQGAS